MVTPDEFWQREYNIGSSWAAWSLNAWGLRRAADIIWHARTGESGDGPLNVVYMMLTGYALENVIKVLLIHMRPELCTPRGLRAGQAAGTT